MAAPTGGPAVFWMAQAKFRDGTVGVVEIIREFDDTHRFTVLCSTLVEGSLRSQIGFSNDPIHCEEMTRNGFTFIEALITHSDKDLSLTVGSPAFLQSDPLGGE